MYFAIFTRNILSRLLWSPVLVSQLTALRWHDGRDHLALDGIPPLVFIKQCEVYDTPKNRATEEGTGTVGEIGLIFPRGTGVAAIFFFFFFLLIPLIIFAHLLLTLSPSNS